MQKQLSEKSMKTIEKWLGEHGKAFFKDLKEKYGTLNCVYSEGGIPHPVHLREGMQVRNYLRTYIDETKDWSQDDFDDNWEYIILKIVENLK